jgi:hypothetical protein
MFGRLSLRNTGRLSVAHLYFSDGKLVYVVGNRGNAYDILQELKAWSEGFVRFDTGNISNLTPLSVEYEQVLDDVVSALQRRGVVALPQRPRTPDPYVIEGKVIITQEAQQLITPWEWQVLTEGTRRVSLAVAHLVGPKEALSVLQDILDDCAAAFPAFASLTIAPTGYLHIADRSQFDSLPRADLLDGFTALFATCEYFCSPIIGEHDAHVLMVRALREMAPLLAQLGVFHIYRQIVSGHDK